MQNHSVRNNIIGLFTKVLHIYLQITYGQI